MSRAAALKAHETMRAQRAAAMGVELVAEHPYDSFEEGDASFWICPGCETVGGTSHACSAEIRRAREEVLDAITPALRAWGWAWVDYLLGEAPRPAVPSSLIEEARDLELRIAAFGLADPEGFVYGVDNLRLKRKGPRRHTRTGKQPEELRRHLVDQRNHRSGRMY